MTVKVACLGLLIGVVLVAPVLIASLCGVHGEAWSGLSGLYGCVCGSGGYLFALDKWGRW